MTYSQRRINAKTTARSALKGNWLKSIAVWLLLFAVIAGITLLLTGTLYAASPADFDIAVTPNGIHTTGPSSGEEMVNWLADLKNYLENYPNVDVNGLDIFSNLPVEHTSPLGTGIIWGFSLLISVVSLVMSFGIYKFYLSLVQHEGPGIGELFSYFATAKRFFGCILMSLLVLILVSLWGLLFGLILSVILTAAIVICLISSPAVSVAVICITALLFVVCSIAFTVFLYRYEAAILLFIKNDGGVTASVKASKAVMKKHKFEYLLFELSFLGWWMLTALTFGILSLYVMPYYTAAQTAFINSLIEGCAPADNSGEPMPDIPNFTDFLPKE